ncbi:MAG TPA: Hpt domain-containing protein, partial [Gemmatimonadales bacterium]|nr:Hpt domain-containing protein [Gemmatimonadales bacterium]
MTADDNAFRELLDDYVVECLPLAERAADAAVELERHRRAGDPADELLAAMRGTLHTIKGNSAMMGLAPMQELAHALEDLLPRREEAATALLIEGTALLVEQVRQTPVGGDPGRTAAFLARVREIGEAAPAEAPAP